MREEGHAVYIGEDSVQDHTHVITWLPDKDGKDQQDTDDGKLRWERRQQVNSHMQLRNPVRVGIAQGTEGTMQQPANQLMMRRPHISGGNWKSCIMAAGAVKCGADGACAAARTALEWPGALQCINPFRIDAGTKWCKDLLQWQQGQGNDVEIPTNLRPRRVTERVRRPPLRRRNPTAATVPVARSDVQAATNSLLHTNLDLPVTGSSDERAGT
ncbi:hypothetical protein WJX75_007094 [Coccomyxa subellipsoidea]|uniref:Uncharacterized protein n=1 Tax=Coccomyxa subellipsoidea TaxID=248742 RepID=A0ABR2YXE4_9CHLO